ncbi:MAG: hypothetical protein EOP62_09860 [Sphingomonadales bacterium]|nr:MAG: hypothetical protein EOP62_09860 [Sphingomonadales bacterium]
MRSLFVSLGLVLAVTLAVPAIAQDAAKAGQKALLDDTVKPCDLDDTVKPNAKVAGGKVSVKDMTGPMKAAQGTSSGGAGTGKVSMQDMSKCAAPKP